jgi:hypothetical protein
MIELRIYCRQLFHFGAPRVVVKVRLDDCAEAHLRESSAAKPPGMLAKVEAILKKASRAQTGS